MESARHVARWRMSYRPTSKVAQSNIHAKAASLTAGGLFAFLAGRVAGHPQNPLYGQKTRPSVDFTG